MKASAPTDLALVLEELKDFGLLLETDGKLPSVSSLVAREAVRGSWWAHPRSHEIFAVLQQIADHEDVCVTRLVAGKVTFVHRCLWSDLLAIATAREAWQMQTLSAEAQVLLKLIEQHGQLRSDTLEWAAKFKTVKPGKPVRELEKRILIHSEEFHAAGGAHAKLIETWEHWHERSGFKRRIVAVAEAKRVLEQKLHYLNVRFASSAVLPWLTRT